jgi:hypothetical protein
MFSLIYVFKTVFSLNNFVYSNLYINLAIFSLGDFFKPKLFEVIMFSHV